MKRFLLFVAAALMVSTVLAGFKYEGEWGKEGGGPGEFSSPYSVDVAPNGRVYVGDVFNYRIQYFTPTGSYLGEWGDLGYVVTAVAPSGNVYAGGCDEGSEVKYFTPTGSLLGSWAFPEGWKMQAGGIGTDGKVYTTRHWNSTGPSILYFTPTGSLLGSWGKGGRGDGEFDGPMGVSVSPAGRVYVVDEYNFRVQYFTREGSFLGKWGSYGGEPGEFHDATGVAAAPDGSVFVADSGNHRIQHFTGTGSFLEEWGSKGSGPGEFNAPADVAVNRTGARVYVADMGNDRIQYFRWSDPAVAPASLGKVKALFR
jgi:tripartite motif-containing protein 71